MSSHGPGSAADQIVRYFRHVLLWLQQLEGAHGEEVRRKPWRTLEFAF